MRNAQLPYKVEFNHSHDQEFRGVINRHNRRRALKLSRLGKLMNTDMPYFFLHHTNQLGG
jgi:hypothetical protein